MNRELIPVRWFITGRTALRNRPKGRDDWRKPPLGGGPTGSYTMRRTWRRAKQIIAAQGKAGKYLHSYLITHTMPAEYSNEERRGEWRRFLDRFRKERPVSYAWVTELHTGGGAAVGRIHHHMVVSFSSTWWYTKQVRRWSWAYSGSSNGLDIRPVRRGATGYLAKYLCKGLFPEAGTITESAGTSPDAPSLPFRWWGYGGIPTTGITWIRPEESAWCSFKSKRFDGSYLWIPGPLASSWAACSILTTVQGSLPKLPPPRERLPNFGTPG